MTRRDWGLIVVLAVLWGSAFILIEIGLRSVPPNTLVFARMALAVPPLLLLLRMRGEKLPQGAKNWGMLSVLGILNVVLPFILFYWGMTQISTGLASILNATTPLWGVVAAHFLTRDEKATPARVIGVLFGVAGIAVMIGVDALSGMTSGLLAQIACLIATLCYALGSIYGRKFGASGMTPLSIATGQVLTSAIIMLPIALIIDAPWTLPMPGLPFWFSTAAIAVFSTSLAYYLYFQLLESAGASNSLLVTFLIPIVAILLGIGFLGESFTGNQAGGMILIALGLIMLDGRLLQRSQKFGVVPKL
jgi:drug/metabolite transporter (DMT)-like permease